MNNQSSNTTTDIFIKPLEEMFVIFNEIYFNSELKNPWFIPVDRSEYGSFNPHSVIHQGKLYTHEIHIPIKILNENIDEIAACLLHNMIHYYGFITGMKVDSNEGTYHNKRFRKLASNCDLTVVDSILPSSKYGCETKTSDKLKEICSKYSFNKPVANVYEKSKKKNLMNKWVCPKCGLIYRDTINKAWICPECYEKYGEIIFAIRR